MPGVRIPTYQQQTTIQDGAPAPSTPMDAPTNNVGSAIQGLGQATGQVADTLAMVQKDAAITAVAAKTSQLGLQINQLKNDSLANAPAGGYGLNQGFQNGLNQIRDQALDGVTDPYQHKLLTTYFENQALTYGSAMQNQEASMRGQYIAQNVSDAGDNAARVIEQDPSQYNATLAPVLASIGSLAGIDGNLKASLTKKITEQAASAAGTRMATDNPTAYLAAFNAPADQPPPAGAEWIRSIDPTRANLLATHAAGLVAQQQNANDRDLQVRTNAAIDARNHAIDIWQSGQKFSPDYAQQLLQTAAGTSEEQPMRELIDVAGKTVGFSSLSLAAQKAQIDSLNTQATTTGVDDLQSKYLSQIQALHAKAVTDYKADPWNAAADRGVIHNLQTEPITDSDSAIAVIQSRMPTIGAVEDAAGQAVSPLQPLEAHQLSQYLSKLPPAQRGQAVNDIGYAMGGNAARIGALATQLGKDDNVDRLALLAGTNNLTGSNGQRMSSIIYQGAQFLKDKQAGIDDKQIEGVTAQVASQVRDAFVTPQASQDAIDTAKYLYAYNVVKGGSAASGSVDSDAVKNAVSGAVGGVTAFNGRQTALPYGWDEDRFNTSVKGVNASNLVTPVDDGQVHVGQTSMPVADFLAKVPTSRIVRVSPTGTYAIQAGTGYATNSAKQPILIRLK